MVDDVVILIPAYNPDEKLSALIDRLRGEFVHIVIVNDGSKSGRHIFEAIRGKVDSVVVHPVNRGKGAALRTGFAHILDAYPDIRGVVTADADGQHSPEDILRVAEVLRGRHNGLVLGVRTFSRRIPLRSLVGNIWTRLFFFVMTGLFVSDTQTGLRGIPRPLLPRMLELKGDRYEYEMHMLVDAKRHEEEPVQLPIETVYIDDNRSSHFNPVLDAFRTQWVLIHYCFSSVLSFLIDNAVFMGTLFVLHNFDVSRSKDVLISLCAARLVSSNLNFFYNRFFVFRSASTKRSFFQYWGVVIIIAAASYFGVMWLTRLFNVKDYLLITVIKIAVETVLFFLSYWLQKKWIFRKRRNALKKG